MSFRHDPVVVQEFGRSRKLRCKRCGKYFGMNDDVRTVIPWDDELEHFYSTVYSRR